MLRVWKQSPLLRVLVPFTCGILLQIHVGVSLALSCALLISGALFWCFFHFVYNAKYITRLLHGFVFSWLMLGVGIVLTQSTNPLNDASHIFNLKEDTYDAIELRIAEAPIPKTNSYKSVAEVVAVWQGNERKNAVGNLLVYLKKDSLSDMLAVDDTILIASKPSPLHEVQNPFEFNYKQYLNHHFIYSQVYAAQQNWMLKAKVTNHSFFGYFIAIREGMLSMMKSYGVEGQEYAVLSALVLGKTSEIDYHLMLSYASAGAIHILAVSGLHVALIYMLLSPLMKKLFPRGKYKLLKTVLPILLLWMYAGVTGFSPSVLRAAWMFTCFIIADNFSKRNNIYNTMSASALILLWWNPYMIMEVGFQLSYLAVLGIVILQRKIDKLLYSKNWLVRWAWGLTAVSIAAQVATFALGLLYFHQFPNLFLISNLFVIPLSSLILYLSLAFFAFAWFPPIAKVLIRISEWLTWLMNESMLLVDSLPYSITKNISISILESYLVAGISVFICYWLFWKKPSALLPTLSCAALLSITQVIEKTSIVKHKEICVHNIPKHNCITYCNGEEGTIFYDKDLIADESRVRFHLKNYWDHLGIKRFNYVPIDSISAYVKEDIVFHYPFLQLGETRFVMADSIGCLSIGRVDSDFYLFNDYSKSVFLNDEQMAVLKEKAVIIGEEVKYKRKKFMQQNLNPERMYDLEQGALIIHHKSVFHFSEFY